MRPDFRIEANGRDITAALRDRLLDLRVSDESGDTADTLELTLDDRAARVPFPPDEADFKVWLGYWPPHTLPVYLGRFVLDEVTVGSGPRSMTIRAKAAAMTGPIRDPKSHSWHATTFGALVTAIARANGLTASVAPALADLPIDHADQTEESDIAFLTRLAGRHGAVAKAADGKLVVAVRGAGESVEGESVAWTIDATEVSTWRATFAGRGTYDAVETTWQDHDAGAPQTVRVGEGQRVLRDNRQYASEAAARRAAAARRERAQSGKVSIELTLPGRPQVFAEGTVLLTGFREEVNGRYSLKRVVHALSSSGYTSQLSIELGAEGEANTDSEDGA